VNGLLNPSNNGILNLAKYHHLSVPHGQTVKRTAWANRLLPMARLYKFQCHLPNNNYLQ